MNKFSIKHIFFIFAISLIFSPHTTFASNAEMERIDNPQQGIYLQKEFISSISNEICERPEGCKGYCYCEVSVALPGPVPVKAKKNIFSTNPEILLLRYNVYSGSTDNVIGTTDVVLKSDPENSTCDLSEKNNRTGVSSPLRMTKEQYEYAKANNRQFQYCVFVPYQVCCCKEELGGTTKKKVCNMVSGSMTEPSVCQDRLRGTVGDAELDLFVPEELPEGKNCTDLETAETIEEREKITVSISPEQLKALAAEKLNPLKLTNVNTLIGRVIAFFMGSIGTFALVLYIWAGFLWMTAAGNSERVASSKKVFIWTTLGVVVMLGSYLIIQFLFSTVLKIT